MYEELKVKKGKENTSTLVNKEVCTDPRKHNVLPL